MPRNVIRLDAGAGTENEALRVAEQVHDEALRVARVMISRKSDTSESLSCNEPMETPSHGRVNFPSAMIPSAT